MAYLVTRNCGHCHECGEHLRSVLDGEEWCAKCHAYRRYLSHGWGASGDDVPCTANYSAHLRAAKENA